MIISPYNMIDTPALLVDLERVKKNLTSMQQKADTAQVKLRPHTKTHKMPYFAKMQMEMGAAGICVAKVGEAEVMADAGIRDIFIATEIVGLHKLKRLRTLSEKGVTVHVSVDDLVQVQQLAEVFDGATSPLAVRIEVEVGENRSGILCLQQALDLAAFIRKIPVLYFEGIFCHEGHTYKSKTLEECRKLGVKAQQYMITMAQEIRAAGFEVETVSIGSTPSMLNCEILPGITEIRPGTYIFMDAAQGQITGDFDLCAATVLGTVVSLPTEERIILDTGAKALTAQVRQGGICNTPGLGMVKNSNGIRLAGVFDEHGIILNRELRQKLRIGDKLEIIPNHICPAVNLYDKAYLVSDGQVLMTVPVSARGKTQ